MEASSIPHVQRLIGMFQWTYNGPPCLENQYYLRDCNTQVFPNTRDRRCDSGTEPRGILKTPPPPFIHILHALGPQR